MPANDHDTISLLWDWWRFQIEPSLERIPDPQRVGRLTEQEKVKRVIQSFENIEN